MIGGEIPAHMRAERRKHHAWRLASATLALAAWYAALAMVPPVLWIEETGVSLRYFQGMGEYLLRLAASPGGELWRMLFGPPARMGSEDTAYLAGILAVCPGMLVGFAGWAANPFRDSLMIHGDSRFATKADVKRISEGGQMGPDGKHLHLGYFHSQRLALEETLSVLVMAPPGTGKTVGLVVPGILSSDEDSMLFYDPKPEVWDICSGWRAGLGPAFRLDWSKQDEPEKGVFHPRFNFLARRIVPDGPDRDTFVDSMAKTLLPEDNSSDRYFRDKGRAALTGFIHFLISKIYDRTDASRYDGLPEKWRGQEASLAMLVDWLTTSQREASAVPVQPGADPLRPYMQSVTEEAERFGYHPRCLLELQPLVNMAEKERSGVLGTMDQGLLSFKNQAVAERTSHSDFVPSDLRGMLTDEALGRMGCESYPESREDWDRIRDLIQPEDWKPVTVGICIKQVDAPAFSSLTTLMLDICSKTLLSYGPGETTDMGVIMGPSATCFMMDEFAKLSKSEAVLTGPDLGRSKKVYYCLIAQDISQIRKTYTAEDKEIIVSTTAVKYVLPQNSPQSIKEISEMAGKTTVRRKTLSRSVGFGKDVKLFGGNQSEVLESVSLLGTSNLTNMPKGTHLLLMQGHYARPVQCRTPLYFQDPKIAPKAWNPYERKGLAPAAPVPEALRARREAAWLAESEAALRSWQESVNRFELPVEHLADTPGLSP